MLKACADVTFARFPLQTTIQGNSCTAIHNICCSKVAVLLSSLLWSPLDLLVTVCRWLSPCICSLRDWRNMGHGHTFARTLALPLCWWPCATCTLRDSIQGGCPRLVEDSYYPYSRKAAGTPPTEGTPRHVITTGMVKGKCCHGPAVHPHAQGPAPSAPQSGNPWLARKPLLKKARI